jgi:hypothetical protein
MTTQSVNSRKKSRVRKMYAFSLQSLLFTRSSPLQHASGGYSSTCNPRVLTPYFHIFGSLSCNANAAPGLVYIDSIYLYNAFLSKL